MSSGEVALRPVADNEQLARFLIYSKWIRGDQSVRPDAFIPFPWPELSVTRHLDLADHELWLLGQAVADQIGVTLHGRADVIASNVTRHSLRVVADEPPRNHANITGWPADKPKQKVIALEIAATAKFIACSEIGTASDDARQ